MKPVMIQANVTANVTSKEKSVENVMLNTTVSQIVLLVNVIQRVLKMISVMMLENVAAKLCMEVTNVINVMQDILAFLNARAVVAMQMDLMVHVMLLENVLA